MVGFTHKFLASLSKCLIRPEFSATLIPICIVAIASFGEASEAKPAPQIDQPQSINHHNALPSNKLKQDPTTEVLIPVKQIIVVGSSILTEAEIASITAPYSQKSLTLSQLRTIADQITQIYQSRNYITSRAIIEAQEIKDGVVTIRVLEGSLARVELKRAGNVTGRLNDDYVISRASLAAQTPLNFTRLEEELQLLRSDPLIADIRANLTASDAPDKSILQITFTEAKSFSTRLFADNYGSVSSGIYRGGINLQEANLTGIGDLAFGSYIRSESSNNYAIGYQYPLNPTGGTLSVSAAIADSRVTQQEFASLNITTASQVYEIGYRQPVVRSPREELTLSANFAFENSDSSVGGQPFNFQNQAVGDGQSQARVLRLIQDYVTRDVGGAWAFRSTFSAGLNMLGATIRTDGSPDGRFFYWTGQALRVQRLSSEDLDTLVSFRLNVQLTGDRLLSLNRFSVGGPQSIRGYRQNQITGDSGIQGSIEFQLPIVRNDDGLAIVKLFPFLEAGSVWNNRTTNPSPQTLLGIGVGAQYQPLKNLSFRVDVGIPLVNANNPGTNLQDSGIYFTVNGNF